MKPIRSFLPASIIFSNTRHGLPLICGATLAFFTASSSATAISRLDTTDTLDTVGAWNGGVVPTTTDVAQWTSDVTATGATAALANNVNFGGLLMQNTTAINISAGGGTLTLGTSGIDMTAATQNLTIACPVSLSSAGQWNVASGRNLAITGVISGTAPATTLNGVGTVTLNQIETFTAPTFTVNGGILSLNEGSLAGSHVLPSSTILGLGGGSALISSPATITDQPAINTLNVGAGASTLQLTRGSSGRIAGSSTNVNRTVGGTVLFTGNDSTSSSGTARFRLPTSANVGSVIPWATFAGNTSTGGGSGSALIDTWAVANGTSNDMIGYATASYTASTATSLGTSGQNSNVTTDVTLASGQTINTIRFNTAGNRTITITSGTLTVAAGGILVGTTVGANTAKITGGTLMGGSPGSASGKDLIVIQNDTTANGALEIDSIIADNTTATPLTKSGAGVLVLGGANTFTGGIYLNQGTLRLTTGGTLNDNTLTFSNNSSAILALGGVNATIPALSTTAVVAATPPGVQNASGIPAILSIHPSSPATFAGSLQDGSGGGALGLSKTGAGTQTLSGTNSFTGPTSISDGTLFVKNNIDSSASIQVTAPGILDVTTSGLTVASGNSLSGTGSVLGTVTAGAGANLTPGTVGSVGSLTVATANLNNSSNLNLDVLSGGTSDLLHVTGALTLGEGEVINVNLSGSGTGATGTTYTVITYGSLANFTPASFAIASGAVGGLTYTFADTGTAITMTISGTAVTNSTWALSTGGSWATPASNWTPATVPNGLGQTANFGSSISAASTVTLNGSRSVGVVTFNNSHVYTIATGSGGNLIFNNGAATANLTDSSVPGNPALPGQVISANVTLTSNTQMTVTGGETLAVSGAISGAGNLIKSGAGTLNLATANTYAGTSSLNLGTLNFVYGALSDTEVIFGGGTLQYAAGNTEDLSSGHTVTFASTAIIDTNGNDVSFAVDAGNAGAGGLTKAGLGRLSLTSASSYNGTNTISAGTLNIADDASLGFVPGAATTNLTIQSGATLQAGLDLISLNGNRSLILSGGSATFDTQALNMTINGAISGTGVLHKIGSGSLTLSGANTYGSSVVDEGTLAVSNTSALGAGSVTLNGSSVLNLGVRALANPLVANGTNGLLSGDGGGVSGINAVTGSGTLGVTVATGNVDLKGSLTGFSGTISIANTVADALNHAFRFNGATGGTSLTLDLGTLNGAATVRLSTTTTVTLGALQGGASTVLSGSGGSGSTQAVTYSIGAKTVAAVPVDSSFGGIITNGAGLTSVTKVGLSKLTLSGASTYSGATTVSAGTLMVNGSISNSAVTVNSSGILGGGTTAVPGVTGAVTVAAGGTIAPGSNVGTLNTGNLTIAGTYACDVSGTDSDLIAVTGNLNISAGTLAISGTPTAPSYIIATYTGTVTGAGFANISPALPVGYGIRVDTVNKQVLLEFNDYNTWIAGFYPGIYNPAIMGKTADPDGDGMNNNTEFALDGNPASGTSTGKVVGKIASVGGIPTFVLTLPVRTGAAFSAPGAPTNGEFVSTIVDAVSYTIQGTNDLTAWTLGVSEVTGADKTTIETGLPGLSSADWTYRTFKTSVPISGSPTDFLRAAIISQP